MKTRSQTKALGAEGAAIAPQPAPPLLPKYEVEIDFDDASTQWMRNKTKIGGGSYKYVCVYMTKKGEKCRRSPVMYTDYCVLHVPTTVTQYTRG